MADPRAVGITLVQPEDLRVAIDYSPSHANAGLSAPALSRRCHHASRGELLIGMVPPEALRFHVGEAVRVGHARRIGHGADVMHEDGAVGLLAKQMESQRVLVEVARPATICVGASRARTILCEPT